MSNKTVVAQVFRGSPDYDVEFEPEKIALCPVRIKRNGWYYFNIQFYTGPHKLLYYCRLSGNSLKWKNFYVEMKDYKGKWNPQVKTGVSEMYVKCLSIDWDE